MSLTLSILGARLRQARTNVGMTQEEAAATAGMPRTALVQVEAGNRNLSTIELYGLASLYKVDVASFLVEADFSEAPFAALCRTRPEFGNRRLKCEIERHLSIYGEGVELDHLLGDRIRVAAPSYDLLSEPRNFAEAIKQGEVMATQERKRLGLGSGAIPDVAEVIASQGIWASSSLDLPDDISGIFMQHESIGMAILINGRHQRGRRRFSYAHEFAHALVDRRSASAAVTTKSNAHELIEKRANSFASEFLMPASGIQEVLSRSDKGGPSRESLWLWEDVLQQGEQVERRNKPGSQSIGYQDVTYLSIEFGVSYDMAVYRLSDIGAISRQEIDELRAFKSHAFELIELFRLLNPNSAEEDQPYLNSQVGLKALDAYCRGLINVKRLLELFESLKLDMRQAEKVFAKSPIKKSRN